jgi:TetR/AcrR family transcriptional repressor of nem operon
VNDQDTRTRLLDAAQEMVQRVGANAMSYGDLSDAVGIRKASIHHHFPAKSDLLLALITRYNEHFHKQLEAIRSSKGTGAAKVARYGKLFEATLQQDACEKACPCGMLGAEISTLAPDAAAELRRFYRSNAEAVAAMLEEGKRDGSLRFDGSSLETAWVLFTMLEGAMLVCRAEGGVELFRAVFRQFQRLVAA